MKTPLIFAIILLAGCAGTPPKPNPGPQTTAPAATTATTGAAGADAKTAADRRFEEETRSYKVVERNGQKYYCRSERASGSNIKAMNCFSESQMRARVEDAEAYRRKSKASVCSPDDPRCGGA